MAIAEQRLLSDSRAEIVQTLAGDRERTWVIRVDSVSDDEDSIYLSGSLPLIGSSLNGNPQMTLRSYSTERIGKFTFRVVGKYSSRNETRQEREERLQEQISIPWMFPPTITCPVSEYTDEPLTDKDGKAIRNSFGTPFSSVQPRRRWVPIIRVRCNVSSIPSWYYTYAGLRNTSDVIVTRRTGPLPTFPAGTLLFVPGEIGETKSNGAYVYDELPFELHYDPNQWLWKPADYGPQYLTESDEKAYFQDGAGWLDGTGHEGDEDNPYIHEFQYYDNTADFSVLPLEEWS